MCVLLCNKHSRGCLACAKPERMCGALPRFAAEVATHSSHCSAARQSFRHELQNYSAHRRRRRRCSSAVLIVFASVQILRSPLLGLRILRACAKQNTLAEVALDIGLASCSFGVVPNVLTEDRYAQLVVPTHLELRPPTGYAHNTTTAQLRMSTLTQLKSNVGT